MFFFTGCWHGGYQVLIADIVRFLLIFNQEASDRRDYPSIKKFHYFLKETGGFSHKQDKRFWEVPNQHRSVAFSHFMKRWAQFKSVCFFHFADVYHWDRRLAVLPNSKAFNGSVDELLEDRAGIETFFRKALYAKSYLKEKLDYRVFEFEDLGEFPKQLKPLKPTLANLTAIQLQKMGQYQAKQ